MISDCSPSSPITLSALTDIWSSIIILSSSALPLLTASLTLMGRAMISAVLACSAAVSFLPNVSRLFGAGKLVASRLTSKPIGGLVSFNVAIGASKSLSLLLIPFMPLISVLLTPLPLLILSMSCAFCLSNAASSRSISSGVII